MPGQTTRQFLEAVLIYQQELTTVVNQLQHITYLCTPVGSQPADRAVAFRVFLVGELVRFLWPVGLDLRCEIKVVSFEWCVFHLKIVVKGIVVNTNHEIVSRLDSDMQGTNNGRINIFETWIMVEPDTSHNVIRISHFNQV